MSPLFALDAAELKSKIEPGMVIERPIYLGRVGSAHRGKTPPRWAKPTLIWLDQSSPRRYACVFLGLRVRTVIDRTHPKTIHPLNGVSLHYQVLLLFNIDSFGGFLLERAKGTSRVGLRYDG